MYVDTIVLNARGIPPDGYDTWELWDRAQAVQAANEADVRAVIEMERTRDRERAAAWTAANATWIYQSTDPAYLEAKRAEGAVYNAATAMPGESDPAVAAMAAGDVETLKALGYVYADDLGSWVRGDHLDAIREAQGDCYSGDTLPYYVSSEWLALNGRVCSTEGMRIVGGPGVGDLSPGEIEWLRSRNPDSPAPTTAQEAAALVQADRDRQAASEASQAAQDAATADFRAWLSNYPRLPWLVGGAVVIYILTRR